ncbi:TPA: hypothetical protein ACNH3N_005258, partial [Klebsiella variicola]
KKFLDTPIFSEQRLTTPFINYNYSPFKKGIPPYPYPLLFIDFPTNTNKHEVTRELELVSFLSADQKEKHLIQTYFSVCFSVDVLCTAKREREKRGEPTPTGQTGESCCFSHSLVLVVVRVR